MLSSSSQDIHAVIVPPLKRLVAGQTFMHLSSSCPFREPYAARQSR